MSYQYNLSGALTKQTYPSGREVYTELDVSGDIAKIYGKANSSAINANYANNFTYTADGKIASLKLGNGLFESAKLNSRSQATEIAMGHSVGDGSLVKLNYDYGEFDQYGNVDATKNAGNIVKQTVSFSGMANPFVQTYTYDSLNRLESATETSNSTQTWKQEFSFDRYGNRNFVTGTGHTTTLGSCTTMCNPTFDTSNNRITSSGFSYDSSGNTTGDWGHL